MISENAKVILVDKGKLNSSMKIIKENCEYINDVLKDLINEKIIDQREIKSSIDVCEIIIQYAQSMIDGKGIGEIGLINGLDNLVYEREK